MNGDPEGKDCDSSWLSQICEHTERLQPAPREGEEFDFASLTNLVRGVIGRNINQKGTSARVERGSTSVCKSSLGVAPTTSLFRLRGTDRKNFAQGICRALKDALKVVGKRRNKASGRAAPWWTLDCKDAHLQYRSAASVAERNRYANSFRATVAVAKSEHRKRKVEAMKSSSDIFGLMRWATPRQIKIPPPLMHEGRFVLDQAERAEILRDTLLARCQASEDLAPCSLSSVARIPWTEDLTDIEVRTCTIGSGNTSTGADEISVELLAACWKDIGTHVKQLFRACVRFRYHPSCFKLAEVVFFQKSGPDPSLPKGWRPISLLYCLGKGLERLLVKRISHLAILWDIVGDQQNGALPKLSGYDSVSCVVHDIEEARTQ
ncbi:hypothetical protein K3495_g5343 [Podosphaera aphanis]|nr:hypothetical protein K3495_g5343 [Podosphaera aphanis]